ncbi:hypothetical protein DKL61_04560 [Gammaproteobacteria bacterium ESL0073]|nr:hypothetical protein DKL61_04560 [Gammaproteobacteria bacterium ESL0073]
MRIEQGVKVFRTNNSQYEDLQENEIVVIEGYDDKYDNEFFQLREVKNGVGIFSPVSLKTLRMGMYPGLKNTELYYDIICDCYELDTAIKIAKKLNEDLKRGDV